MRTFALAILLFLPEHVQPDSVPLYYLLPLFPDQSPHPVDSAEILQNSFLDTKLPHNSWRSARAASSWSQYRAWYRRRHPPRSEPWTGSARGL